MLQLRTITLALAAAAALAGGAFAMVATQEGDGGMEAWLKAGKPGPQHAMLAKLIGDWTAEAEITMAPGAPPTKTPAACTYESMFEGRFIVQRYKSTFMGQAFEGYGMWGFDNTAKQYVSYWIDSMGTMALISKGKAGDDPKVITVGGDYSDPMTGGAKASRNVITIHNDDSHTMEMFEKGADGKEVRTLVIRYTRKK
jgi:hypothetical protein